MKKQLFILVCALSIYSNTNGQNSDYETLTYKTWQEKPENRTLLQRIFSSKETKMDVPKDATIQGKLIVKGRISLYEVNAYPDNCNLQPGTKPFYFLKTEKGLFPLLHHQQSGTYIVTQPYIGMLIYCLNDWDKAEFYINRLRLSPTGYSAENLTQLINDYNKFKNARRAK